MPTKTETAITVCLGTLADDPRYIMHLDGRGEPAWDLIVADSTWSAGEQTVVSAAAALDNAMRLPRQPTFAQILTLLDDDTFLQVINAALIWRGVEL